VTLQTDTVTNIPCGTAGGVTIVFEKIEVVNKVRVDIGKCGFFFKKKRNTNVGEKCS